MTLIASTDRSQPLKDQVALVTGGGRGIGRASAVALAEAGADVAVADIDLEPATQTTKGILALGRRAFALGNDVGDVHEIDAMVSRVVEEFGRIDILVASAGVTRRAHIMDVTEADWDRIHRVNAKGLFFCLQRTAREMIPRRSGRIINMASIAGKGYREASNAAYAASKGAVIALTYAAAQQLAQYNINVNAICPGITRTPLSLSMVADRAREQGVTPEELEHRRIESIPLRRANEPEDIAGLVVFLASTAARNITGQAYNVDGGLMP